MLSSDYYSKYGSWDFCLKEVQRTKKEFVKSENGGYFILMDDQTEMNSIAIDQLKSLISRKEITTIKMSNFKSGSGSAPKEISKKDLILFPEWNLAWTRLEDKEAELLAKSTTDIILQPDRKIFGVKNVFMNEQQVNIQKETQTWGVEKTGASLSNYTGKGAKIAILDTGYDQDHPYFRKCTNSEYFVGESSDDDNGHGMHCAGIACGAFLGDMRLGIAVDADVYACKILDKNKTGRLRDLIMGIYWALNHGCHVILLALEDPNDGENDFPDLVLARAFRDATNRNCFVVAAAGNKSIRSQKLFRPLSSPADNPISLAIGAIEKNNDFYELSNRALRLRGVYDQEMSYAAPGGEILSLWSSKTHGNTLYKYQSGTSMAAAFVCGILGLYWEKYFKIWSTHYPDPLAKIRYELEKSSERLNDSSENIWPIADCGRGLPKVP